MIKTMFPLTELGAFSFIWSFSDIDKGAQPQTVNATSKSAVDLGLMALIDETTDWDGCSAVIWQLS